MTLANKDIHTGVWEKDSLNGKGTYTNETGKCIEVTWHNGIMIPLADQGKCWNDGMYLNLLFVLLIFVFVILAFVTGKLEYLIGSGICYII